MKVIKLRLKSENGEAFFDSFDLVEGKGISCDPKAKGGDRQLSLGDEKELILYREQNEGLCVKRYMPNISTEGLDYKSLTVGTRLHIGESVIEITEIGKKCFPECDLVCNHKVCNMKYNCAFAKVIIPATIKPGDTIA